MKIASIFSIYEHDLFVFAARLKHQKLILKLANHIMMDTEIDIICIDLLKIMSEMRSFYIARVVGLN